ncbi:hypothetical protein VTJ49DRAFT_3725 [Mycothermus thermophilus]|uniref:Major facilitator superfamily (MFS) profile domain-containing protein n=1 Tax=Humicola insolens TaxID=85995 RepID=A0ABR3V7D9_HUMIN
MAAKDGATMRRSGSHRSQDQSEMACGNDDANPITGTPLSNATKEKNPEAPAPPSPTDLDVEATKTATITVTAASSKESISSGNPADPEIPSTSTPTREHPLSQGWRPWLVVPGGFFLTVPTYGLLSAIGLFLPYWHDHVVADEPHTEADIAWILSVFSFLDNVFAAPAGIIFDRLCEREGKTAAEVGKGKSGINWLASPRLLLVAGRAAYLVGFVGLACSDTYDALVGSMVVVGVSAATPTTIAYTVASQWFEPQGGGLDLATGLISLGAPLGGIFFSLALHALFTHFGSGWRSAGLVLTAVLASFVVVACCLVRTNPVLQQPSSSAGLPLRPADAAREAGRGASESVRTLGQDIVRMLRSIEFWPITCAIVVYELVLIIQWGTIPLYAVTVGASSEQFYLMLSHNVGAIVGRTVPLWLSDRFLGPLNTTLVMNLFTLLVVLAIWLPLGAASMVALYAAVVLMGIGTGSFVPLGVGCMNVLATPETVATWFGLIYGVAAFAALVGNPISAAILARYQSDWLMAFLAGVLFLGMISAAALRWRLRGRASKVARVSSG